MSKPNSSFPNYVLLPISLIKCKISRYLIYFYYVEREYIGLCASSPFNMRDFPYLYNFLGLLNPSFIIPILEYPKGFKINSYHQKNKQL